MPKICTFLIFCLLANPVFSQKQKFYKYWIEFSDKNDSPFCTCRPAEFLSANALERRAQAGISVVENDLPVNPNYVKALKLTGAEIHGTSRWLNAVAVKIAGRDTLDKISNLPFVKKTTYLGPHLAARNPPNRKLKRRKPLQNQPKIDGNTSIFGYSTLQNSLLGTQFLYDLNARGQEIGIAVMDGGFTNVDTLPFFDSAAVKNHLFSAWDFVEKDNYVFESAAHGTSVLSVMAADLPGYFVGTAPAATYFCIKTEDTGGEFPIEEVNWILGAEFADSLGAHIVNASLGYTAFNDTSLSHNYLDLDGRTAIGSRGATIAAQKGMIICNSAGNSGDEPWHFVGVPADAPGIISVGAVDKNEKRANFSSFGPTADGRIKPDLVAPGEMIITASTNGADLGFSSGTSVASPMLAGGLASLWSAFPEKTAAEILDAAFESANQTRKPDNSLGWGLPNLGIAWLHLAGFLTENHDNFSRFSAFPKSKKVESGLFSFKRPAGELSVLVLSDFFETAPQVVLKSVFGKKYYPKKVRLTGGEYQKITLSGLENLPPGSFEIQFFEKEKMLRTSVQVF